MVTPSQAARTLVDRRREPSFTRPEASAFPDRDPSSAPGYSDNAAPAPPTDDLIRVAQRLQAEFGNLLAHGPADAQTPAGLVRWLSISQPVAHRLISGVRHRHDPLEALAKFPGVEALRGVINAARERGCKARALARVEAATTKFAEQIARAGGSHRKLLRAVSRTGPSLAPSFIEPHDDNASRQRLLFESFAGLTGNRANLTLGVEIARLMPPRAGVASALDSRGTLSESHTIARLAVQRAPGAMQLTSGFHIDQPKRRRDATPFALSPSQRELMTRFGNVPTDAVHLSEFKSDQALLIFDPDAELTTPLDVFAGPYSINARPHPTELPDAVRNFGIATTVPSRWLVLDVYLDRRLAAESIPSVGVFATMARGRIATAPVRRWFDRLPIAHEIVLLGSGLDNARCPVYERYAELAGWLFDQSGWNPREFVGHRLLVSYPIYGCEYVMSFDFAKPTIE